MFIKNWKVFENSKEVNEKVVDEIQSILYILNDEGYQASVYRLFGGQIGVHIDFPRGINYRTDKLVIYKSDFIDTDEMQEFDDRLREICDSNDAEILNTHDTDGFSRNYNIDTGYKPKITYTVLPPR